ncbi:sugar ABC transporter ATP-binding protein [Candidatus Thioglobus sp.]|nr:sugar ABC transporter ATP-binding protein [Candidatus Thioglobus sp.]
MEKHNNNAKAFISFDKVSKSFGATKALINCSVSFEVGKIHALVGENGAGKSTLGKLILGVHKHDSGSIKIDGKESFLSSPRESVKQGLVGISQELSLLPDRSVVDNIAIGRETTIGPFVSNKQTLEKVEAVMEKYDLYIEPSRVVGSLSVADQQKVEILRALNTNARLIVFDEPTARLASHEADQLHNLVHSLAKSGTAVVYISHFLEEVLKISDTITLLRNGEKVRTEPTSKETKKSLIEGMTGRDAGNLFPKKPKINEKSEVLLKVKSLSRANEFKDVSFEIKKGEILGIAGLVGSGRSELAHAIYGNRMPDSGSIELNGKEFITKNVAHSIKNGMAMVPESRRDQGLILERSLLENTSLPYLEQFTSWIYGLNKNDEYSEVDDSCKTTMIKHGGLEKEVQYLSGGNQQKVLFARAAMNKPKLLIADEPTRGVDIGAKQVIYELISQLSKVGEAVLLISSEVEEIIGMAHRTLVMSRGKVVAELKGNQITKSAIMEAAFEQD